MPGRKHIVIIFDDEHPLKPQSKVCNNLYGKSIINKAINIWEWVAKFAESNNDQPGEAADYKPRVKQCFHLTGKYA